MNYELGIMNGGIGRFLVKRGRPSSFPHSSFLVPRSLRAFTLIELMLVMAIMGLLGTISIGGFRAMRRGMEQSAVMRNVDQFIHNAYLRAVIDRQPTAVYFWNETRRAESDTESLLVVGRAVAVRRAGRISGTDGNYLIDEFGDLRYSAGTDEKGEEESSGDEAENGIKTYLYKMNEGSGLSDRSEVSSATLYKGQNIDQMMTDSEWSIRHSGTAAYVAAYGWYTKDTGWKIGDAYGFEFAEITLPNNYIFGSSFKKKTDDPIEKLSAVVKCSPGRASGSVTIYQIRPGADGTPTAKRIDDTQSADKDPSQRTY